MGGGRRRKGGVGKGEEEIKSDKEAMRLNNDRVDAFVMT